MFYSLGRMGKGTGKADEQIWKRDADEAEERRPKYFNFKTSTRKGRLREKHDVKKG